MDDAHGRDTQPRAVQATEATGTPHPAGAAPAAAAHAGPAAAPPRTMVLLGAGLAGVLLVLLVTGAFPRVRQSRMLAADAERVRTAALPVHVVQPIRASETGLTLPGTTQAIEDTTIYARTSGYIRRRHVDIGDRVKAGQLLAEIESPEVDAQLRQALANLAQAERTLELQCASLDLARVTMDRFVAADAEKAVAAEAVDQSVSAYRTAKAAVAAAEAAVDSSRATVEQFRQLTSFQRVVAPFAGTIVQRNIDDGALITAGSPTDNTGVAPTNLTGAPNGLFEVARVDRLRVFVNVPQAFAANVRAGMPAVVRVRGRLDAPVQASVTRTSQSLDPGTRTLLTQVEVPNPAGVLLPGMFVYVDLEVAPSGTRWRVPATAVIFDMQGTRVATVADNVLRFRKVEVGRDFGDSVDIQAGLQGSETIVAQPTVAMKEGQVVQPVASAVR